MIILTEYEQGSLIAHALNTMEDGKCCFHECAPCKVIESLLIHKHLSVALRVFVAKSGTGWDWWDEEKETINEEWVRERLCDERCPTITDG